MVQNTYLWSEYWKSNPRKYCDFCKCWIADNKPSVEFHERGKRHKENVQTRLEEIGKKGKEDYENKLKEDDYMKEMEEAALKAYKKDIEENPDYTGNKIAEIAEASNAKIVIGSIKTTSQPKKKIDSESKKPEPESKKWFEAKSPEGNSYYWHTLTGESAWEAPEEGFVSIEEQNKPKNKCNDLADKKLSKPKKKSTKVNKPVFGPEPKAQPYGTWETVATQDEEQPDLQLPELPEPEYYVPEYIIKKTIVKFTEKVVTLASESYHSGPVSFKKRKGIDDYKKNARRRDDE